MPLITVIVPVYNVEKYLSRCIDSIRSQTYRNYELILVDDGSKDNCCNICDHYAEADCRIHVIHQENKGPSSARNIGIEWALDKSDSEWITFIDSDDYIHPFYLEALLTSAEEKHLSIAVGQYVQTDGEPLPEIWRWSCSVWNTDEYYLKDSTNSIVTWGKLYKKECFNNRFPEGKIHEDAYIIYKILFQQPKLVVVDQPMYAYFKNENGIMRSAWTIRGLDALMAVEEQVRFFLNNNYILIAEKRFKYLIYLNLYNQDQLQKSVMISEAEKKEKTRELKLQLQRVLIKYRKYSWFPYWKSEYNKSVYSKTFTSIRVSRNIWHVIKKILNK